MEKRLSTILASSHPSDNGISVFQVSSLNTDFAGTFKHREKSSDRMRGKIHEVSK